MPKNIDENFGAIQHHYYEYRREEPAKENEMSWHQKQISDLAGIRGAQFSRSPEVRKFRAEEQVVTNKAITLSDKVLPSTLRGVVAEADAEAMTVSVDFGEGWGCVTFAEDVASQCLESIRKDTMRDMIRQGIRTPKAVEEFFAVGSRVKDSNNHQYVIEHKDVFARRFQVLGERGDVKVLNVNEVSMLGDEEPYFAGDLEEAPLSPGGTVRIAQIDPELNAHRARGIQAGEAAGTIGQTGILEFSYYPVQGQRMYRVLLQAGGRKDFADSELEPVDGLPNDAAYAVAEAAGHPHDLKKDSSPEHPHDTGKNEAAGHDKDHEDINTSANALHALATHADHRVRNLVASHPNTHPKTLQHLSKDNDLEVRRAVSKRLGVRSPDATKADLERSIVVNPSTPAKDL